MTLSEAKPHLAAAELALAQATATPAGSGGYGDRQTSLRPVESLERAVNYWTNKVNELQARARGARNPHVSIARGG